MKKTKHKHLFPSIKLQNNAHKTPNMFILLLFVLCIIEHTYALRSLPFFSFIFLCSLSHTHRSAHFRSKSLQVIVKFECVRQGRTCKREWLEFKITKNQSAHSTHTLKQMVVSQHQLPKTSNIRVEEGKKNRTNM